MNRVKEVKLHQGAGDRQGLIDEVKKLETDFGNGEAKDGWSSGGSKTATDLKKKIEQAVTDGAMTQEQANELLAKITAVEDKYFPWCCCIASTIGIIFGVIACVAL